MFPKSGCQLSMVCDLSTPENKRRDNTGCSAEESDYLRLVGYGGLVDSMYCGKKARTFLYSRYTHSNILKILQQYDSQSQLLKEFFKSIRNSPRMLLPSVSLTEFQPKKFKTSHRKGYLCQS